MKQIKKKKLSLATPCRDSALYSGENGFFKIQTGRGSNPSSSDHCASVFPIVKLREHTTGRVVMKTHLDNVTGRGALRQYFWTLDDGKRGHTGQHFFSYAPLCKLGLVFGSRSPSVWMGTTSVKCGQVVKSTNYRVNQPGLNPALLLAGCVMSDKSSSLSVPQCPHLSNGSKSRRYLLWLL